MALKIRALVAFYKRRPYEERELLSSPKRGTGALMEPRMRLG
jgi:hypothetical protein